METLQNQIYHKRPKSVIFYLYEKIKLLYYDNQNKNNTTQFVKSLLEFERL